MSLLVDGVSVASMTWRATWSGVWSADLVLIGTIVPSGKVIIASEDGAISLVGTVDATRSGTFGERSQMRVVGGGAGWGQPVSGQHYHSDIGVPLASVVSTTAAEAGEAAIVLVPQFLGPDFVRTADAPASQIFSGTDWWVGVDGVTRVGIRPTLPAPLSLNILEWSPLAETASYTCDVLVEPGAIVIDTRFGVKIVREVEAIVSKGSVQGTLWLATAAPDAGTVSELAAGLAAVARAACHPEYSRFYAYRVVAMQGDRVELQAMQSSDGVPDVIPASVWAGTSGYKAVLLEASRVLVGFVAGDPPTPFVAFYEPPEGDGWRPVSLEIDALESVTIGGLAAAVALGGAGGQPVARAPAISSFASALVSALNAAAATATGGGATPVTGTALGALLTALSVEVNFAASTLATACPSEKVVSS